MNNLTSLPNSNSPDKKTNMHMGLAETQHELKFPLCPMPVFVFVSDISLYEDFRKHTGGFGLTTVSLCILNFAPIAGGTGAS